MCKNLTHQKRTTGLLSQSKKYRHLVTINFYAKRFFNLDDLKMQTLFLIMQSWEVEATWYRHQQHPPPPPAAPSALPLPPLLILWGCQFYVFNFHVFKFINGLILFYVFEFVCNLILFVDFILFLRWRLYL